MLAAHAFCSELPIGAKKPGSVVVHSAALEMLVLAEKLPASQGRGAAAPRGQKEPAVQAQQLVARVPFW